jgi:hypothetical protein
VTAWTVLGTLLAGGTRATAADRDVPDAQVVVGLGNYASVPARTLADAVRVAESLLGQAGVPTQWRDCTAAIGHRPCAGGAASRAGLAIDLFGRGQTRALARSPDTLGLAFLAKREGEESVAIVFVEEARVQAFRAGVPMQVVLGHATAHEAGHLLLGTTEHAAAGLVQAHWSPGDLSRAAFGQLRFNEQESSRLRAAVLALAHERVSRK